MNPETYLSDEFSIPILILGFNRPESTMKLIASLRDLKPIRVYFAVDGPRSDMDLEKVYATQACVSEIDWDVQVETRFLVSNLGCKMAVTSAIDWFFEKEEFGIILEDDCLPTIEFMHFSKRMLLKYRNNKKIMHISGSSFLPSQVSYEYNHYFSRLPVVWGWATWKRAWEEFEFNSSDKSRDAKALIQKYFENEQISKWFFRYYLESLSTSASAWSPHWIFSIIKNDGLAIAPMANLVQNIGFSNDSTHASSKTFLIFNEFKLGNLPITPDPIPIEANSRLDVMRFKVIRRADPNTFFLRRSKLLILNYLYRFIPNKLKKIVKILTVKSHKLTKFLQE